LTSAFLKGEDCVRTGIADFFVPSKNLEECEKAMKDYIDKHETTTVDQLKMIIQNYAIEVKGPFAL